MARELNIKIDSFIGTMYDSWGFPYQGFTAAELEFYLTYVEPNPTKVILHLSTEGGDVYEGLKICSRLMELRESGVKIQAIIESICYSMGTVIAMTASPGLLFARPGTLWSTHKPLIDPSGAKNSDDLRKVAEDLDAVEDALITYYTARTGKDVATIKAELKEDKIITAADALLGGWIDEIIQSPAAITNVKATALKPVAFLNVSNKIKDMALTAQEEDSIATKVFNMVKGLLPSFTNHKPEETKPENPANTETAEPPAPAAPTEQTNAPENTEAPAVTTTAETGATTETPAETSAPAATTEQTETETEIVPALTAQEREELERLRAENQQLKGVETQATAFKTELENLKNFVPGSEKPKDNGQQFFVNHNREKDKNNTWNTALQNIGSKKN